jgi:hypothetical protein
MSARAQHLRHITPDQVAGFQELHSRVYSNKNEVDATMAVGDVLTKMGVSTPDERTEAINYVQNVGYKIERGSGVIADTDKFYFKRRGRRITNMVKTKKEQAEKFSKYRDQVVKKIEEYFEKAPGTRGDLKLTDITTGIPSEHLGEVRKILLEKFKEKGGKLKLKYGKFTWKKSTKRNKEREVSDEIEKVFDKHIDKRTDYIKKRYEPEENKQRHYNNKIQKDMDVFGERATKAKEQVNLYKSIVAILNSGKGGKPGEPGTGKPGEPGKPPEAIYNKVRDWWNGNKNKLEIGDIEKDLANIGGVVEGFDYQKPIDDSLGKVKNTTGSKIEDDSSVMTHAALGLKIDTPDYAEAPLFRQLLYSLKTINTPTFAGDKDAHKAMIGKIAKNLKQALLYSYSHMYGETLKIVKRNVEIDDKSKPSLKPGSVCNTITDATLRDQVTVELKKLRDYENMLQYTLGLFPDGLLTEAEVKKTLEQLNDSGVDELDPTQPTFFDSAMDMGKDMEDELVRIVQHETEETTEDISKDPDLDYTRKVRKRTEEIALRIVKDRSQGHLPKFNDPTSTTKSKIKGLANMNPADALSYLKIRTAYFDRDIAYAYILKLLEQEGLI